MARASNVVGGSHYDHLERQFKAAKRRVAELEALINTPETRDFMLAVPLEAGHQRERWGDAHDATKDPEEWFWLVGYLAGKGLHALRSGDLEKARHHTISTAAALANWHRVMSIMEESNEDS